MRVLFSASPGIGHNFPLITTAWAVRAAGHDVLWTTYGNHQAVADAGLPVIDTAPGTDAGSVFRGFIQRNPSFAGVMTNTRDQGRLDVVGKMFGEVSEISVDGTVAAARWWRPDVIVHSPLDGAGPIAAAALDVPSVHHSFSPSSASGGREMSKAVADALVDSYARHGTASTADAARIDLAPARILEDAEPGWQFRYVPFNGGGVLPEWISAEPPRPRVLVTLGSVVPQWSGGSTLGKLITAAADVDAEFLLALGDASAGELPANVHAVPWIPLTAVLPSCAAAVHHGGAGTTFSVLDAGVPQLVLPHGADQHLNAELVSRLGVGTEADAEDVTVQRLRSLLSDTATRAAAESFAAELRALPTPSAIPERLATLV